MTGQVGSENVNILLVEDNPTDARRIERELTEARGAMAVCTGMFTVTSLTHLEPALDLLGEEDFDAVLLDLRLPDSEELETLARLRAAAPDVPVMVLTNVDDDGRALWAIRQGAQDYVGKDRLDGPLLRRIIYHAIQRNRAELELIRHAREAEAARAQIEQQAVELRDRTQQLDRIIRDLDDFTYIASHDLKEPLRGISAYCEIVLEDYLDKLDSDGQRRLRAMAEMCDRLGTSIDDLLTYCRVGRAGSVDATIDLNTVADEVLRTLRPTIEQRRGSVRVLGRLPAVQGNANLIGMVFGNLISNGLKFNKSRQPRVEIGCCQHDPSTVYVRDNGIGIAKQHHEAIFTIFRRLHSRKKYEGTGAGLTIIRKIVESHGGRVWLESEPGRGTTFYFTFKPVSKPPTRPPHWNRHASDVPRSARP